jgi:hypothetical protein
MPFNPEKGPNNKSRNPEIRPGQVPLKDDVARREQAAKQLGCLATSNSMNNKPKK